MFACVLLVLLDICKFSESNLQSDQFLFLGKFVSPINTPSPIDIKLAKTIPQILSPIFVLGILNEEIKIINTGKSVEFVPVLPSRSGLIGGPTFKQPHRFGKIRFHWTDDIKGVAASTINGKGGTALEAISYFYNSNYSTFDEAIKQRNGAVGISFLIHVKDFLDNTLFAPVVEKLKKIKYPGNSTTIKLGLAIGWYNIVPPIAPYFIYPGSYTDEKTGKTYNSVTRIILPSIPIIHVSKKQFSETFMTLKNSQGGPLTNQASQHVGNRPVVISSTLIQFLIP